MIGRRDLSQYFDPPSPLERAIEAVQTDPIPENAIERVKKRAKKILPRIESVTETKPITCRRSLSSNLIAGLKFTVVATVLFVVCTPKQINRTTATDAASFPGITLRGLPAQYRVQVQSISNDRAVLRDAAHLVSSRLAGRELSGDPLGNLRSMDISKATFVAAEGLDGARTGHFRSRVQYDSAAACYKLFRSLDSVAANEVARPAAIQCASEIDVWISIASHLPTRVEISYPEEGTVVVFDKFKWNPIGENHHAASENWKRDQLPN